MHPRPSRTATFACLAGLLVGALTLPAAAAPPAQGSAVPALATFDRLMQEFMDEHAISAGQLAIMRNGVVVFDRAYGWQNKTRHLPLHGLKPLPRGALMRVASVSKPFTAAAVRMLIAQGKLSLGSRVFSLRRGDGGILDLAPFGTPDPRLADITIAHCLEHRAGWDKKVAGDLTYRELEAAEEMGILSPPGPVNMVRYIMGQPLQHDPGNAYAYSNIGYLVLFLVIEKVSGQDYLTFLRQNVTRPIGIADSELILGGTLPADAHPREPYYDHPRTYPNVFYPAHSRERRVAGPYGSFHMEARTGQGRLVTNARSLVLFLDKFVAFGKDIGKPRQAFGKRVAHTGKQRGVSALALQRGDGINYAVIFNKDLKGDMAALRERLNALIGGGTIQWPQTEPRLEKW